MHPDATQPITGDSLPRLGWHGIEPLDHARFEPVTRVPGDHIAIWTKPNGGLWTTPLHEVDGHIGSSWFTHRAVVSAQFWEVLPTASAKVYVVDNPLDLTVALRTYPDPRNSAVDLAEYRRHPTLVARIDWPAMAADYDAFYLTAAGVRRLNVDRTRIDFTVLHGNKKPRLSEHLALWDVSTVLWLNPAFDIGPQHPADDDAVAEYKAAAQAADEASAAETRQYIITAAAEAGVELPEFLLKLPPIGFMMIMAHVAAQGDDE